MLCRSDQWLVVIVFLASYAHILDTAIVSRNMSCVHQASRTATLSLLWVADIAPLVPAVICGSLSRQSDMFSIQMHSVCDKRFHGDARLVVLCPTCCMNWIVFYTARILGIAGPLIHRIFFLIRWSCG